MFWACLQLRGGMSHATRAFMHATGHVMCPLVLVTWKVKGAKHDKVGRKKKAMGKKMTEGKKMHHYSCTTLQFSSFTLGLVYENLYL